MYDCARLFATNEISLNDFDLFTQEWLMFIWWWNRTQQEENKNQQQTKNEKEKKWIKKKRKIINLKFIYSTISEWIFVVWAVEIDIKAIFWLTTSTFVE